MTIPSGRIKAPVSFEVKGATGEGQTFTLTFDAAASVNKIVATGADKTILPPVLKAEVEKGTSETRGGKGNPDGKG